MNGNTFKDLIADIRDQVGPVVDIPEDYEAALVRETGDFLGSFIVVEMFEGIELDDGTNPRMDSPLSPTMLREVDRLMVQVQSDLEKVRSVIRRWQEERGDQT